MGGKVISEITSQRLALAVLTWMPPEQKVAQALALNSHCKSRFMGSRIEHAQFSAFLGAGAERCGGPIYVLELDSRRELGAASRSQGGLAPCGGCSGGGGGGAGVGGWGGCILDLASD